MICFETKREIASVTNLINRNKYEDVNVVALLLMRKEMNMLSSYGM